MTDSHTLLDDVNGLTEQRQRWIAAYQAKDIATLSAIETKEFFVINYQTVEKKADWHNNVLTTNQPIDPLLMLSTALKTRHDTLTDTSHVITSYFKHSHNSTVVKEMWVYDRGAWHLASLALTKTQIR